MKIFQITLILILMVSCTKNVITTSATANLFNDNLNQPLELYNPNNSEQKIVLNLMYNKNGKRFANGTFLDNNISKVASLNARLITNLDNNTKRYTYYAAPFEIQETPRDSENYLGLFRYDNNQQIIEHLDSFFVGSFSTIQDIKSGLDNSIDVTIENWNDIALKNNLTTKVSIEYTDTNFVKK